MTKEEFEEGYCNRSKMSRKEYRQYWVTLPCCCGDDECEGWAAMENNTRRIMSHLFPHISLRDYPVEVEVNGR